MPQKLNLPISSIVEHLPHSEIVKNKKMLAPVIKIWDSLYFLLCGNAEAGQ